MFLTIRFSICVASIMLNHVTLLCQTWQTRTSPIFAWIFPANLRLLLRGISNTPNWGLNTDISWIFPQVDDQHLDPMDFPHGKSHGKSHWDEHGLRLSGLPVHVSVLRYDQLWGDPDLEIPLGFLENDAHMVVFLKWFFHICVGETPGYIGYIHIYISAHNMYIVVIECYEYHSHHFMMLEISRASILATVPTFFLTNVSWHIFWIPSAWQIFWHIFWQSWRFNHDNFYGTSSLTYSMFCQVPWHLSYICLQYVLSISLTFILHMPTYKRCQL